MNDAATRPAMLGVSPSIAEAKAGRSCLVIRKTDFLEALADPRVQSTLARARAIGDLAEGPRDARELSA